MAKKKARKKAKRTTKKSAKKTKEIEHELPGGFWRQIVAVLLLALAVILIITWFGSGGSLLNRIHAFCMWLIGWAAYLLPILLVFIAIKIFRGEGNRVSPAVWLSAILLVIWSAGIAGIPTLGQANPTGGIVGAGLNSLVTQVLAPAVAIFIYAVLIFITLLFMLQLNPSTLFQGIGKLFKKSDAGDLSKEPAASEAVNKKDVKLKINAAQHKPEEIEKPEKTKDKAEPAKALMAISDPNWKMPATTLLENKHKPEDAGNIQQNAFIIKSTLAEFGIDVEMEGANIGPRVTQYTMRPPAGVNLAKITSRDKELALNLAVDKIRIEAPIPGTRSVGVELPNVRSADVRLRSILESEAWQNATSKLTFVVGKDISGEAVVADLAKMPHLLIAGTTGSGKSVMTNALITSLLYRNSPSDLKLIIIDPKQVEMAQYNDIPHLLTPIITSPEKTLSALKWAVNEMERRYSLMAKEKVKKIDDYNKKMAKRKATVTDEDGNEQQHDDGQMPYIVIVVDEMSDLMMMAGKDLEMSIVRVAQKGRAAGVHLVLATQRPEVKVITGLIKANVPGRIAFAVGSQIDSRIMLDKVGAEKLLGKGDMLMLTTEMMGKPRRIQGALASDADVQKVTDFLREQRAPEYNDDVIAQPVQIKGLGPTDGGAIGDLGRKYDPNDPIVRTAVEICLKNGKFATSLLQTHLGKGHGFVSGLGIWLEQINVIGPPNGNKPRDLLISSMEEFDEITSNL